MMQLKVHLHERFLHVLDVRRRILQQALALPKVRPERRPRLGRVKAASQEAILVQLLEPLGIVDICLTAWNVLDMPRIDQQHVQTSGFQNLEDWYPVGSAAGEVPKIGPFPSAFPQTGRDRLQSSGFPVTQSAGRWWSGRPA